MSFTDEVDKIADRIARKMNLRHPLDDRSFMRLEVWKAIDAAMRAEPMLDPDDFPDPVAEAILIAEDLLNLEPEEAKERMEKLDEAVARRREHARRQRAPVRRRRGPPLNPGTRGSPQGESGA